MSFVFRYGQSGERKNFFAQQFEESGASTKARHKEWHWSADFMVGRDIGLGGQPGQVKIGVRIAELRATTNVVSAAFESFGAFGFSSAFTQRSKFFGIGPRAAIDGSVMLQGPWSLDYGAGVAVLYGNRNLVVDGTFTGFGGVGQFRTTSSSRGWVPNGRLDRAVLSRHAGLQGLGRLPGRCLLERAAHVQRERQFVNIDRYFHGPFLRGTARF